MNLYNNLHVFGAFQLGTINNVETAITALQGLLNYANNYLNLTNVYISTDLIVGTTNFNTFVSNTNNSFTTFQTSLNNI